MTYLEKCYTKENKAFIYRTFGKMESDHHKSIILDMVENKTPNIWSLLAYMAKRAKVQRYMEIGVRRGYSMAMVAGRRPDCTIVGFDMWKAGYGGAENPGPIFVEQEMAKLGYRGHLEFINGDSALTVPDYYTQADEPFDLILVDGDHSYNGMRQDIKNALPLLSESGYLIVDDLHDETVIKGWRNLISDFKTHIFTSAGRVGIITQG